MLASTILSFNLSAFSSPTTQLLCLVLLLFFILFYKQNSNSSLDSTFLNLPTWKNFPLVGCFFSLGNLPHQTLANVAFQNFQNKIFKIRTGFRTSVVFSNLDDVMNIAKKFPDQLFGKPTSFTTNHVTSGAHNDFVNRWKKRRAYTNAGLKHMEKNNINQILNEEVSNLMNSLKQSQQEGEQDLRDDVAYHVSRVLYRMSYGDLSASVCDKLMALVKLLHDYTTIMGSFSLFNMLPGLHRVFKNKFQKFIHFNNLMQAFCDNETKKKLQMKDSENSNLLSFFSHKLEVLKNFNKAKYETLEPVFFQGLVDIIRAGTESTSLLVHWVMLYVTKFPHIQHKMREEIQKVLQENKTSVLEVEDLCNLNYCNAVVAESLRYCSLNPFLKRELTGDIVTKDGVKIPKGTSLLFNNYAFNFDPNTWADPHDFKPGRFLDDKKIFDQSFYQKLLSFGFGNRRCIGVQTGKSLAVLMASRLVASYHLASKSPLDIQPIDGIGLSPKPFKVNLEMIKAL